MHACAERLRSFADTLKTEVDFNKDGKISEEEFVRGYCKWAMLMRKAETSHKLRAEAAAVYVQ